MKKINLSERFRQEICTFEIAKRLHLAGMTCANTFFAYDEHGEITDAGWLESVAGMKLYPCVNFAMACAMMEDTDIDFNNVGFYQDGDLYKISVKDQVWENANIVDLLMELWIKYKKKQ